MGLPKVRGRAVSRWERNTPPRRARHYQVSGPKVPALRARTRDLSDGGPKAGELSGSQREHDDVCARPRDAGNAWSIRSDPIAAQLLCSEMFPAA